MQVLYEEQSLRSWVGAVDARRSLQQRLCIRMARCAQDGCDRSTLHNAAGAHYGDALGQARDDAQIVRDEHQRHASRAIKVRNSARICAWMVTSSAVVGSSAMSSSGSQASAIAIITR